MFTLPIGALLARRHGCWRDEQNAHCHCQCAHLGQARIREGHRRAWRVVRRPCRCQTVHTVAHVCSLVAPIFRACAAMCGSVVHSSRTRPTRGDCFSTFLRQLGLIRPRRPRDPRDRARSLFAGSLYQQAPLRELPAGSEPTERCSLKNGAMRDAQTRHKPGHGAISTEAEACAGLPWGTSSSMLSTAIQSVIMDIIDSSDRFEAMRRWQPLWGSDRRAAP